MSNNETPDNDPTANANEIGNKVNEDDEDVIISSEEAKSLAAEDEKLLQLMSLRREPKTNNSETEEPKKEESSDNQKTEQEANDRLLKLELTDNYKAFASRMGSTTDPEAIFVPNKEMDELNNSK